MKIAVSQLVCDGFFGFYDFGQMGICSIYCYIVMIELYLRSAPMSEFETKDQNYQSHSEGRHWREGPLAQHLVSVLEEGVESESVEFSPSNSTAE